MSEKHDDTFHGLLKAKRNALIGLGAEQLADALLDLSYQDDAVGSLVETLTATPQKNLERYQQKLARLKQDNRFIRNNEMRGFLCEIQLLLKMLQSGTDDPKIGVEGMLAFFQMDEKLFCMCEESIDISTLFVEDARALFIHYATRCSDKTWLADQVLTICLEDRWDVRDVLFRHAAEYLPESVIRDLVLRLWRHAEEVKESHQQRHAYLLIELLAKQLRDAPLAEKARSLAEEEPLSPY